MSLHKGLVLHFIFFISISTSFAQVSIKFDKITVNNGLSQGKINWILQDSQGFLWFATDGGLNRFDGSQFTTYIHSDADSNSISSNIVNHVYEDDEGNLWISTQNGLDVFEKSRERFVHFKSTHLSSTGLGSDQITCTIQDLRGNFWIGTEGGGLNKLDRTTNEITSYKNINKDPFSISSNYVTCLERDKYGYIWIGTSDNGLNMLHPESGKILRYYHSTNKNAQSSLSSNRINTIYEDNDGDLWIGTEAGIDLIKPINSRRSLDGRDEVINFHRIVQPRNSPAGANVLSIFQGASSLIWFGTTDDGLGYLNKYSKIAGHYTADPNNDYSIISNNVQSVFDDRYGILWIGTNAGINKIDRQKDRFTWHKRAQGNLNTLSSNNTRAILLERSGLLWIGTFDKGLTMYNPQSEVYTNYLENDFLVEGESIKERRRLLRKYDKRKRLERQPPISFLSHNRIHALHRDQRRRLWIATGGGGLNVLHLNTGRISKYRHDPEDENSIGSDHIRHIYEDSKGNFWIGTEDAGLNLFIDGKFKRFTSDENDVFSLGGNDVRSIVEDAEGNLWIGTFGGGVNKFNPEKNKFTRYYHIESNQYSISSNSIYTLLIDDTNRLWIGTTDGLNILDLKNKSISYLNQNDGLPSNSIYSILQDNSGNIWLSTNKGISRIDKATMAIRNYGIDDGLQSTEFNPGVGYVAKNGKIFFGGINGYCSFDPSQIKDNQLKPEVLFTDFRILNESVTVGTPGSPLEKHISETDSLILSYKDVSISFEFVALNYTDSRKNEYAYMMENFESKWNYVGSRQYANYTNLKPGNYVFHVKASNNDGIWNEEGKSIYIVIKPPFWQTWWFYTLSFLFLVSAVFMTIQLRTRALHRSNILLEEQVKLRTKQIENQNKILANANEEIIQQKDEIENQNKLLKSKNSEISKAKKELDKSHSELISINANLENIVAERTSSIKKMNEELINSNNELDLFIYRASHDLKGPIARLLGMTILAKLDNKDEGLREYIDLIEKGAVDINKILNKLNNIHFINRELVTAEEIDFYAIIKEIKTNLKTYIDASNLRIKVNPERNFSYKSDPMLMKIILENLIENSVLFRRTKKVEVEVNLRTSRKWIIVSVEDNGSGILKAVQDKIFNMFYRGSERSQGNGLGLYLVRKAVQKLHGKIDVDSQEGKYSCFTIYFPKVIVPKELKSLVR